MIDYCIYDDLEKYCPEFEKDKFKKMPDEEVIEFARNYYKNHLPVNITAWLRVNEPDERLIYKKCFSQQIRFIRDNISCDLFYGVENVDVADYYDQARYEAFQPVVIGTHMSKSVLLPVMEITLKTVGVKMILRDNFYDWCVSIESDNDINCDFKGLITDRQGFYEGFPKNKIYPPYTKDNKKRFSFCIGSDYDLYVLMFLLRDYLYFNK